MVADNKNDKIVFWGCFIALITTAFGFISRMFLIKTWGAEFSLDPAQEGRLAGIGIWPFAVSIIGFSLVIDRIGYKTSMIIAFLGHIIWAIMGVIIWKYFGLHMTLYIAGLQDIPTELKEAARIDGANAFQVFKNITFPLLKNILSISVLLSILGSGIFCSPPKLSVKHRWPATWRPCSRNATSCASRSPPA